MFCVQCLRAGQSRLPWYLKDIGIHASLPLHFTNFLLSVLFLRYFASLLFFFFLHSFFAHESTYHKLIVYIDGRLCVYVRGGTIDWKGLFARLQQDEPLLLRCGYWLLEMVRTDVLEYRSKTGADSYVTAIFDLHGWALSKQITVFKALRMAKQFLHIVNTAYPELIHRVVIVRAVNSFTCIVVIVFLYSLRDVFASPGRFTRFGISSNHSSLSIYCGKSRLSAIKTTTRTSQRTARGIISPNSSAGTW